MDGPRQILIGAGLAFSTVQRQINSAKDRGRRRQKPLCRSMLRRRFLTAAQNSNKKE
jgi:hypothetical protein